MARDTMGGYEGVAVEKKEKEESPESFVKTAIKSLLEKTDEDTAEIKVGKETFRQALEDWESVPENEKAKFKDAFRLPMWKFLENGNVSEMLRLNLGVNATMDYSRINITEMLMVFNFNRDLTVTHWRMGRVMDGWTVCANELKICESLSVEDLPAKIYQPLSREGGSEEKKIPLMITDPFTKEKVLGFKASLADFSHFMNIMETNESLGTKKLSLDKLAYYFFTGQEVPVVVEPYADKEMFQGDEPLEIDLAKVCIRDDLSELAKPDEQGKTMIDEYRAAMVKYKSGLQLLESFRSKSKGHRENAGHAFQIKMEDGSFAFVPLSGRMAAEVTASDLRKQSSIGPDGHPQEVAQLDEEVGVAVRFRRHDLYTQRKHINSPQFHNNTSPRMMQMAVGLASGESLQVDVNKETKRKKKIIHLGGKWEQNQDGELVGNSAIVNGMHNTHDKLRNLLGLKKLTDAEASDLFMTDVIAPFFLNNPYDWMMCLATVYQVKGVKTAQNPRAGIVQSMSQAEWNDFELKIVAKDNKDGEIKELTFHGYPELEAYINERQKRGEIDQVGDIASASSQVVEVQKIGTEELEACEQLLKAILHPDDLRSLMEKKKTGAGDPFREKMPFKKFGDFDEDPDSTPNQVIAERLKKHLQGKPEEIEKFRIVLQEASLAVDIFDEGGGGGDSEGAAEIFIGNFVAIVDNFDERDIDKILEKKADKGGGKKK